MRNCGILQGSYLRPSRRNRIVTTELFAICGSQSSKMSRQLKIWSSRPQQLRQ